MAFFAMTVTVAHAAPTIEACSISGTFTHDANEVISHSACTGSATIPVGVTSIGVFA